MTITLGISAATGPLSIGLLSSDGILAEMTLTKREKGIEFIDEHLESLCAQAQISLKGIDLVGVVNGPGQYTGLRLSVAAAKTVAQVVKVPVVPISTLAAQVFPYRHMDAVFFSVIPARPGEVNCALLSTRDDSIRWLTDAFVARTETLLKQIKKIKKTVYVVGNCPEDLRDGLVPPAKHLAETIRGVTVAEMALEIHGAGDTGALEKLVPKYSYPPV